MRFTSLYLYKLSLYRPKQQTLGYASEIAFELDRSKQLNLDWGQYEGTAVGTVEEGAFGIAAAEEGTVVGIAVAEDTVVGIAVAERIVLEVVEEEGNNSLEEGLHVGWFGALVFAHRLY